MTRVAPETRGGMAGQQQPLRTASSFMRERTKHRDSMLSGLGSAAESSIASPSCKDNASPVGPNSSSSVSSTSKTLFIAVFVMGWAAGMISSQCLLREGSVFCSYGPCNTRDREDGLDGASSPGAGGGDSSGGFLSSSERKPSLRSSSSSQQDGRQSISAYKQEELLRRKEFAQLLKASKSDKYERHHYEQYYSKWFEPYREQSDTRLLEIGAADGKSMNVWDQYFSGRQAQILGLAYGRFTQNVAQNTSSLSKVEITYGDQSKFETMEYLISKGPFDIIIDDGSHVPQHMIYSLFHLWDKAIKPGGIYVLEDLETNYWTAGTKFNEYILNGTGIGVDAKYSAITKIEQITQVVISRRSINAPNMSIMTGDADICNIEWGMNVVAIHKCDTGVNKPPFQHADKNKKGGKYDVSKLQDWITKAKKSNPIINIEETNNNNP